MRFFRSRLAAPALIVVAAACQDPAGPAGPAARLEVVGGDAQQDTVSHQLDEPLAVRVVDDAGRPVAGHPVSFLVTAGGGGMFTGATLSDAEGVARDRWTLGAGAGTQHAEARALSPEGEPLQPVLFEAVAIPDAPARTEVVSGDGQAGVVGAELEAPLIVLVTDAHGNPVPDVALAWAVTSGGGAVTSSATTTDAQGHARARWELGPRVATQVVEAAAAGTPPAVFSATPLVAGELHLVQGDAQTDTAAATLATPVVVALRLPDGRPVVGATIVWTTSGGSPSPPSSITGEEGQASTIWTVGSSAGTQTLTAAVENGEAVAATATVLAGAPVDVRLSADSAVLFPVGDTAAFSASAFDRFGNPIPAVSFTWSSTDEAAVTASDGVATASGTGRAAIEASSGFGVGRATVIVSSGEVAFASDRDGEFDIFVMNRDGTGVFNLTRGGGHDHVPAFSPGGDTIAFASARDGGLDLYLMDLSGTILARLTDYPGIDSYPTWSPDGSRIAFERQEADGSWGIYVVDVTGGPATAVVVEPGFSARFPSWSPDGTRIAYTRGTLNSTGSFQDAAVALVAPDGSNISVIPGQTAQQEYWPAWSPDGSRIAYVGATVLETMNPDGTGRTTVSTQVFSRPAWSPAGDRLAFGAAGPSASGFTDLELYSTAPDGSDRRQLTTTFYPSEEAPSWR